MHRVLANAQVAFVLLVALGRSALVSGADAGNQRAAESRQLVLRYRRAASEWNEALPIGNGRLGAMVFGATGSEFIQLNEDTIWAGERRERTNPEALILLR